jgi:uncharacterized Tic20 family protein
VRLDAASSGLTKSKRLESVQRFVIAPFLSSVLDYCVMNEIPPFAGTEPSAPPPPMRNERTWVILCHLTAVTLFVGLPFGNVIGPLVVWLLKKNESLNVDAHGKEALNFQISMTIYTILAGLSCFALIGFVLLPVVLVANLVLIIIASIKASNDEFYRYPLTIRMIT